MTNPSISPPPGSTDAAQRIDGEDRQAASRPATSSIDHLVRQAQAGSHVATGLALESFRKYLSLAADRSLDERLRSKVGASDLVQVTLHAALRHFRRFEGSTEEELRAWLSKILFYRVRYIRRKYRTQKADIRREHRGVKFEEVVAQLPDHHVTPASVAVIRDEMRRVQEALPKLSETHREVLVWHTFQGVKFGEIGQRRGCSADAARKQWARALLELQKILKRTK